MYPAATRNTAGPIIPAKKEAVILDVQVKSLAMSQLLTNEGEGLPDDDGRVEAGFPQVICDLTTQHGYHSTAQVRQS